MKKLLKKGYALPLIVIIAIALVVFKVKSKPPIMHEELHFPVKTVEVIEVKKIPFRAHAVAYGNVEPAVLLESKAEVSGKISYIHPALKKGGSLSKGTIVLRIEPTIFEFTLEQNKANLAASKSSLKQLSLEEDSTRKSLKIAEQNLLLGIKELNRLQGVLKKQLIASSTVDVEQQKVFQLRQSVEDLKGKLSTYTSRNEATKSQIKQSQSLLDQSQDMLSRTEISIPFDARVGFVSVEKDEFVTAGSVLFEALGTDAVEISAEMATKQFRALLMGFSGHEVNLQKPESLSAIVSKLQLEALISLVSYEDNSAFWNGELLRIGESIDPTRDTINLVVAVNNPYQSVIPGKRPPLLKGMYTRVDFFAPANNHFIIPRRAIHQGRVYVATDKNKLEIRTVEIILKQNSLVVIGKGLEVGDKVIVTDVIPVINNLPLNIIHAVEFEKMLAKRAIGSVK